MSGLPPDNGLSTKDKDVAVIGHDGVDYSEGVHLRQFSLGLSGSLDGHFNTEC